MGLKGGFGDPPKTLFGWSTPVGKVLILSIGPTHSVESAKSGGEPGLSNRQAIPRYCLRRCHSLWFS